MTPLQVIDNVFDLDHYKHLEKNFPPPVPGFYDVVSEHRLPTYVLEYFKKKFMFTDEWKDVEKRFINKNYFMQVCNHFKPLQTKILKNIIEKDFTLEWRYSGKDYDIGYDMIFTENMYPEEGLRKHVDKGDKVFQTMIYFKELDDCSEGGNFTMSKTGEFVEYNHNRLINFWNCHRGWHHVTPKYTGRRRMISVSYEVHERHLVNGNIFDN